jgi:hypothetical protein
MPSIEGPTIEQWMVAEPPTSEAVAEKAVDALRESGIIDILVRGELAEIQPTSPEISFIIRQVFRDEDGSMVISGKDSWLPPEEQSSYIIRPGKNEDGKDDPSLPATIRIVRP